MESFYIKTYGCQMNVYDSERMADALVAHGYTNVIDPQAADIIIFNTCHIREKAAEKLYSDIGRVRSIKDKKMKQGRDPCIVVAGCVAQAQGEAIFARAPDVDVVVGPQSYQRLPEMIDYARGSRRFSIDNRFSVVDKFDRLPPPGSRGVSAYLSIQEGCDKFCTFCVVPYTRGAEYSRSVGSILEEGRMLATLGAREIILLGQNVNAYRGADVKGLTCNLADLIALVADIDGIDRIRYTTSHPVDMDETLYDAHATIPELMPFCHLPIQSGSDRILKAMGRRHTVADYYDAISAMRRRRPDIAFSSDFIVAFPGEDECDIADTLALVEKVGFAQAYSFIYSPRPGTPAAIIANAVPETEKKERLWRLQGLLRSQQNAFNQKAIGTRLSVLIEGAGKRDSQVRGRSPWMQMVYVSADTIGTKKMVDVAIDEAGLNALIGRVVHGQSITSHCA